VSLYGIKSKPKDEEERQFVNNWNQYSTVLELFNNKSNSKDVTTRVVIQTLN